MNRHLPRHRIMRRDLGGGAESPEHHGDCPMWSTNRHVLPSRPALLALVSLAEVIGAGTPVAAMFATPALCASQYCGPVLDELLDVLRFELGEVDRYP